MPAPSWRPTLVAALVAALSLPGLARADTACDTAGYAYAGVRTATAVRGIRAVVTPLEVPQTASGPVSASLAVGRATVGGKRGVLRAGLLAAPGEQNRLYYEILTAAGWRVYVGPYVEPGVRHSVAIVEMAGHRGRWRVWFDGRPTSRGFRLTSGRVGRPAVAAADTALDGSGLCSDFRYRFARVAVLRGRIWRHTVRTRVIADPGYAVLRSTTRNSFVAVRKKKPAPPPAPEPTPEQAPAPAPTPEPVTEDFVGDWETGDFSQWSSLQRVATDRISLDQDAHEVAQGIYSGRFEVRDGDSLFGGERAEAMLGPSSTGAAEGVEQWWSWKTRFQSGYTPYQGNSWHIFTQWHHSGSSGQSNLMFEVDGTTTPDQIHLRAFGGANVNDNRAIYVLAPFETSRFYHFVLHVKWSSDASVGFIEVWVDGVKVVPLTFRPTLYTGQTAYLKQGLYRTPNDNNTDIVHHDAMVRGESLEDVAPELEGVL